jgi:hypothetical protein
MRKLLFAAVAAASLTGRYATAEAPPDITLSCVTQEENGKPLQPELPTTIEIWLSPPRLFKQITAFDMKIGSIFDAKVGSKLIEYRGGGEAGATSSEEIRGTLDRTTGAFTETHRVYSAKWSHYTRMSGQCSLAPH